MTPSTRTPSEILAWLRVEARLLRSSGSRIISKAERVAISGRLTEAATGIERLQSSNADLLAIIREFDDLITESRGVDGLHLNGDIAPWDWLMNNEWLAKYAALRKGNE